MPGISGTLRPSILTRCQAAYDAMAGAACGTAVKVYRRPSSVRNEGNCRMPASIKDQGTVAADISAKWGWFVVLGVVMIALGAIARINVGSDVAAGMIHAFLTKEWYGFAVSLSCGVLYLIGGLLIMNEPVQGALALTILAGATLAVSGIMRIVLALEHRDMPAWGIALFSGVVSIVVGCLLYVSLPWSGLWVLGTLIAVDLVVQGVSSLYFGLALRTADQARGRS
jgi:uncharacterized membrane protein HdeD (DUF308 family)